MRQFKRFFNASRTIAFAAIVILLSFAAPAVHAATWIVSVGGSGLIFDPKLLTIAPGDNVVFINGGGVHNVVADDGSFRCAHGCDNDGHGGSGAPSNANWLVNLTFPDAGTFGYYCETHGAPGVDMYGTIIVQSDIVQASGGTESVPALNAAFGIALALLLVLAAAFVRKRRPQAGEVFRD